MSCLTPPEEADRLTSITRGKINVLSRRKQRYTTSSPHRCCSSIGLMLMTNHRKGMVLEAAGMGWRVDRGYTSKTPWLLRLHIRSIIHVLFRKIHSLFLVLLVSEFGLHPLLVVADVSLKHFEALVDDPDLVGDPGEEAEIVTDHHHASIEGFDCF